MRRHTCTVTFIPLYLPFFHLKSMPWTKLLIFFPPLFGISAATPELSPGEENGGKGGDHEQGDENDRSGAPSSAVQLRLDMFFPFDPYLLRKSGHYIKGSYLMWKSFQNKDEDEDEHEHEDEEDVEVWKVASTRCSFWNPWCGRLSRLDWIFVLMMVVVVLLLLTVVEQSVSSSDGDDEELSDRNMSMSLGSSMRSNREGTTGTISPLSKPSVDSSTHSFDDPMKFSPIWCWALCVQLEAAVCDTESSFSERGLIRFFFLLIESREFLVKELLYTRE